MMLIVELNERLASGYRSHLFGPFTSHEAAEYWVGCHRVAGRIVPRSVGWGIYPKTYKIRPVRVP